VLSREKIKEVIPYDEPFLFVDKVERIEDNRISGLYQTSRED
jgi:3-hydroxymyristoyl/3-hydroxydecanoyl-(acyl carrier protein) dehydratase